MRIEIIKITSKGNDIQWCNPLNNRNLSILWNTQFGHYRCMPHMIVNEHG